MQKIILYIQPQLRNTTTEQDFVRVDLMEEDLIELTQVIQDVNGSDYTIWFDGFGSLLFSVKQGNFNPYRPAILEIEIAASGETFTIPHLNGNYDYEVDWGDGSPTQRITT